MKPYPKIETLFQRKPDGTVDPSILKIPVVATINCWVATEKIDGTNIRVGLTPVGEDGARKVLINGRTDNAQIPGDLVKYLYETFTLEKMKALFEDPTIGITLYGEGCGPGIQKNGADYFKEKRFVLFDVAITSSDGGFWWQDDEMVTEFAERLGIPRAPIFHSGITLATAIGGVRNGIMSQTALANGVTTRQAEGLVLRPIEPLFDKRGNRIIVKLKTKDFGVADAPPTS